MRLLIIALFSVLIHAVGVYFLRIEYLQRYAAIKCCQKTGGTLLVTVIEVAKNEESSKRVMAEKLDPQTTGGGALKDVPQTRGINSAARRHLDKLISEKYFSAGQLTRQPYPLGDIDLSDAAIDEVATEGAVELTILVDEYGVVIDVRMSAEGNAAREFLDRISLRFQGVRFSPGEIDGRAVKSELKVVIVSESNPLAVDKS